MTITAILFWSAAALVVLLAAPLALLFVEVLIACFVREQVKRPLVQRPPRTAVLIPAHNEEAGIGPMLVALRQTLRGDERLLVVADNCTDHTASIARHLGVEVIERCAPQFRGKGFALDYGVKHLAQQQPPEVLVILDADCRISEDGVARLAYEALLTGKPVQGLYLCHAEATDDPKTAISALAFQFKNQIRPLGLGMLGGPGYLTGSGMALPWSVVGTVPWASGNLVEDMQLGIDLAIAGHTPRYFDGVQIDSDLPIDAAAAAKQRTRWEHGHLKTLLSQCPRLFVAGCSQQRFDLLLLGLDLAIPPLALLATLWMFAFVLSAACWLTTAVTWPLALAAVEGGALAFAVLAGWLMFCRDNVPWMTMLALPGYVVGKFNIYRRFLGRPQTEWVRTERPA